MEPPAPPSKRGLTKKEINRFSKKELKKICMENGIVCNSKTSKTMMVAEVMKNKKLRRALVAKPKRKMSDKQRQSLEKFRFKKSTDKQMDVSATIRKPKEEPALSKPVQSSVKVDPTASNKNEPAPLTLKQDPSFELNKERNVASTQPKQSAPLKAYVPKFIKEAEPVVDFKTSEIKDDKTASLLTSQDKKLKDPVVYRAEKLKAQLGGTQADADRMKYVDSHTARLRAGISLNKQLIKNEKRELSSSTNKTTDYFDRDVRNRITRRNKRRMRRVMYQATHNHHKDFEDPKPIMDGTETQNLGNLSKFQKLDMMLMLQKQLDAGLINQDEFTREINKIQEDIERSERKIITEKSRQTNIQSLIEKLTDFTSKKKN